MLQKKFFAFSFLIVLLVSTSISWAKPPKEAASEKEPTEAEIKKQLAEIEKSFKYATGTVELRGGIATMSVPKGFKFMDETQAKSVLTDLWGNPKNEKVVGILFPEKSSPLVENSYAFVISYDEMGYVKDEDAASMNYDELLKNMQEGEKEVNSERKTAGFEPIHLVRWASTPYYDSQRKALHWAKELEFGGSPDHTLNYDIRILGRKGILSFNAVGGISVLNEVKPVINDVISSTNFTTGNRYADYNSSVDKVASYTVGSLVAGKVLAKVGFFAIILKYLKFIVLGIAAVGGSIWRFFTGKKEEVEPLTTDQTPTDESEIKA